MQVCVCGLQTAGAFVGVFTAQMCWGGLCVCMYLSHFLSVFLKALDHENALLAVCTQLFKERERESDSGRQRKVERYAVRNGYSQ